MVIIDKDLKNIRENQDSAFTILMWNISKDNLILELKHKLALISNIKNTHKRIKYNDRIYSFLSMVEKSSTPIYSQVVFIGSENPIICKLDKKDIEILKEYDVPNFTIENGENFNIAWIEDLLENFNFTNIIVQTNGNKGQEILTHWIANINKKKIIKQNVDLDYIKGLSANWFFVGKMLPQYKTKYMIGLIELVGQINWQDVLKQIKLYDMKKNISVLQEHLDKILIDSDKYIFGNDILELISQYNIKTLFIHTKIKNNFDAEIAKRQLGENLNFEIVWIDDLENNGIQNASHSLLKNYSGMIGIKYY